MWYLTMAELGAESITVGSFATVTAAARKIIELEDYPVTNLFFVLPVETATANDEQAFDHLEHTGRSNRRYVLKRVPP